MSRIARSKAARRAHASRLHGRKRTAITGPVFAPLVRNGLFAVSVADVTKRVRALDATAAKFAVAHAKNPGFMDPMAAVRAAHVREIEPTIRYYRDARMSKAERDRLNKPYRAYVAAGGRVPKSATR